MEFIFSNNNEINNDIFLEDIHKHFKLPIYYVDNKLELPKNINDDLELYSDDINDTNKLYNFTFEPNNDYSKNMMKEWSKYYTNDINFLQDTQVIIKKLYSCNDTNSFQQLECWNDVKKENNFKDRFHYVDWSYFRKFNESSTFLQILSIYNMSSPILSLAIPIIMLILPFFILKIQGISITLSKYYDILKMLLSRHTLGKLFTDFSSISWSSRIYIFISIVFYFIQIYQNVMTCIRFHNNLKLINNYFNEINQYIDNTINNFDQFLNITNNLKSYQEFNKDLLNNKSILVDFRTSLNSISEYGFKTYFSVGYIMKWFYIFYYNTQINNAFMYSFGFNGYFDNLLCLSRKISNKQINFCKYNNKNIVSFKDAYYAPLINKKSVKNSYNVNTNLSITGPNASGKTTLLKTTLFNIILSQQIGCGFYKKANIMPYKHLHCYLNIPDTSGRDSLFQAEARRCREIITCIDNSDKTDRHFCIFDELYSGTNPYEAVASAFSFIKFLNNKNINFMLTTHYVNLCESLEREELCENFKMEVNILKNKDFSYTYRLLNGISEIKGGVKVLKDLEYPKEIISNTEIYLENN